MRKYNIIWFLTIILLLIGCGTADRSESGQAEGFQSGDRTAWPNDVEYYKNIKYGSHRLQALDLWVPPSDRPVPLVLYIHGGGFIGGDKTQVNIDLLFQYLNAGIAYASVNYRLISEIKFPDTHLDCARAIQHLRYHAEEFNLDSGRIAATGGSAGAGISLWLAFKDDLANPESEDPVSRQSTRLTCAAVLDGQSSYDPFFLRSVGLQRLEDHGFFFPFYGIEKEDMDSERARGLYFEASAINFVTADDIPVLLHYSPWYRNVPVTDHTPVSRIVHHPLFGIVLKEKMDNLGLTCILQYFEHPVSDPITEFDFIRKHIKDD
jgi:hypothetical protein